MTDKKISQINGGVKSPPASGDLIIAARSGANVLLDPADISAMGGGGGSNKIDDFQPPIVIGNYYFGPFGISESDGFYGYGYLAAMPFWCSHDVTFDKIGVSVAATSAGKTMRLGIYANGNNVPGSLILDAGTVPLDASGPQEKTISYAYSANTLIWLASETDDNPDTATFMIDTGFGASLDQTSKYLGLPEAPLHLSYGGTGLKKAGAYMVRSPGALPASFTVDGRGVTAVPAVWLRRT